MGQPLPENPWEFQSIICIRINTRHKIVETIPDQNKSWDNPGYFLFVSWAGGASNNNNKTGIPFSFSLDPSFLRLAYKKGQAYLYYHCEVSRLEKAPTCEVSKRPEPSKRPSRRNGRRLADTQRDTETSTGFFFLSLFLLKVMWILLQPTCFPFPIIVAFFPFLVIVMRVGEETKSLLDGWTEG